MLPLTLALSYVRVAYEIVLKKIKIFDAISILKRVTQGE